MKKQLQVKLLLTILVAAMSFYSLSMNADTQSKKKTIEKSSQQQPTVEEDYGNTVTLVTSGTGKTKEDATNNALRSALEQAFGTFVSSNTQIVNDELTKDEIVSISSGNIQGYNEISCLETQNGDYAVSVKAVVSIGKLVSFAQSHGASTELDGNKFMKNRNLALLNKKNEKSAVYDLAEKLSIIAKRGLYDFALEVGDPSGAGNDITVRVKVVATPNENMRSFWTLLDDTFSSLSMSSPESENYQKLGLKAYDLYYNMEKRKVKDRNDIGNGTKRVILRNEYGWGWFENMIDFFIKSEQFSYTVYDNLNTEIIPFTIWWKRDTEEYNKWGELPGIANMGYDRDKAISFGLLTSPIYDTVDKIVSYDWHNLDRYNKDGIFSFHNFDIHYSSNRITKLSNINIKPSRMIEFEVDKQKEQFVTVANESLEHANNTTGDDQINYLETAYCCFSILKAIEYNHSKSQEYEKNKKQICERLAKLRK